MPDPDTRGQALSWPGVQAGMASPAPSTRSSSTSSSAAPFLRPLDPHRRPLSDSLFHSLSTALLVLGVIQLVDRRRTSPEPPRLALAATLAICGALLLRNVRQPTPDAPWPAPTPFGTLRLRADPFGRPNPARVA